MKYYILVFLLFTLFFYCKENKTSIEKSSKDTGTGKTSINAIEEKKESRKDNNTIEKAENKPVAFKKVVLDLDDEKIKVKEIPMQIIWDGRVKPDKSSLNIPKSKEEFINYITTVANGNKSNFLVLDDRKDRIVSFSEQGKFLRIIGRSGSGPGEFMYPKGLETKNNFIYVFDFGNFRIQKLDMDGKYVNQIKNIRMQYEYFAVGNNEEIVTMAKYGSKNLLAIYNTEGKLLREFGSYIDYGKTERINYSYNTCQLIIDKKNELWCVFYSFPIIRKYDLDGNLLLEIEFKGERVNINFDRLEKGRKESTDNIIKKPNFFTSSSLSSNNNIIVNIWENIFYEINTKDDNYYINYKYKLNNLPKEINDYGLYHFIKNDKLYIYSRHTGDEFICREK